MFISSVGSVSMNDNRTIKPKNERWITLFVWVIFLAMPAGAIMAWWLEQSWPLAITGIAFLIFAAGGAS